LEIIGGLDAVKKGVASCSTGSSNLYSSFGHFRATCRIPQQFNLSSKYPVVMTYRPTVSHTDWFFVLFSEFSVHYKVFRSIWLSAVNAK
jgi:hypothetical protein